MVKKNEKECKCGPGCKCGRNDAFIAIPASLGGILLAIVVMVLIFQPLSAEGIISNLVWGFVALGFFALLFAYKARIGHKK